jgi:hypothetical protein
MTKVHFKPGDLVRLRTDATIYFETRRGVDRTVPAGSLATVVAIGGAYSSRGFDVMFWAWPGDIAPGFYNLEFFELVEAHHD